MPFKIVVPLVNISPSTDFKKELVGGVGLMVNGYGFFFRAAAMATNLPVQVLYTIAFIESRGIHKLTSAEITGKDSNIGIMQINADGLWYALRTEIPTSRLTKESIAILNKYVPSFSFAIGAKIPANIPVNIKAAINTALQNVEFNIWAAAIYLRFMLEKTADPNGTMRLDKVVVAYNVGEFSAPTKTTEYKTGDTLQLLNKLPSVLSAEKNKITSSYVVKAVGKGGCMDYFIRNKIA